MYCDNKGVLNHGGKAEKDLKEKQAQFDVLHVMKGLIVDSPVTSLFRWVEGHSVKKKGLHNCTEPEIMNDFVDKLAGMEYHRAVASCKFIGTEFPFEKLRVKTHGKKITGNLRRELDNLSGGHIARRYLEEKGKVRSNDFPCVWWDGMEALMRSYPKMYRVWTTKHVSGFCGTNKMMAYWKPDWTAMCPSCNSVVETSSHMTRCREEGRRKMLRSSVQELVD